MADNDSSQEKSIDPTPQRLEQARRDGDVPQSTDVHTFASYIALLAVLFLSAGSIGYGIGAPLSGFLGAPELLYDHVAGPGGPGLILEIVGLALIAVAPLMAAPALGVILSLFAQRAITFSTKKIEPKISRINPIEQAKQKFGPTGLVEFLKSTVKLLLIAAVLTVLLYMSRDDILVMIRFDARALPELLLDQALTLLAATTVVVGAIAALDVAWQRHDHRRRLRMSLQELREEQKRTEGDPYFKAARQDKGRAITRQQMMQEVPKADVVIVNPTHYAVALRWSRAKGAAPVCVAKGVDAIALTIREIAAENNVPIHSDPPTARALHAGVEIGDEVQPDHYQAVAVAIRFADAVRKRARASLRRS